MKKSAIAIAVAAVLAAPVALADVTVSGQLQTQIVSYDSDDGMVTAGDAPLNGLQMTDGGMGDNNEGGNWGALTFSASEDLGNGLKALAKYGFNVKTENSGNDIGTRDAYVGLAGGFGAVLAGRMNHPYKTSTIGWDPFLSTFAQARGNGGMVGGLHGSEINNALAYAGTFGGVKVVAAVVLDEGAEPAPATGEDTNGEHGLSFSVNAPVGPVELALAYIDVSEHQGDGTAAYGAQAKDSSALKLGAKFASGDFSVAAQYEMLDKGFIDGVNEASQLYLTGSFKFGNNSVSASYGMFEVDNAPDEDTYMAIGLNHAFSGNTSAFVAYRMTDWAGDNNDTSAIGAGLRVKF